MFAFLDVAGAGLAAFLIAAAVFVMRFGDPALDLNLRVENRTHSVIVLTHDVPMGGDPDHPRTERVRVAVVPPQTTAAIGGRCDLVETDARDRDGTLVDTHLPTGTCDEIVMWIIGSRSSVAPS